MLLFGGVCSCHCDASISMHARPDSPAGCLALRLALAPQGTLDCRCITGFLHTRPDNPAGCLALRLALPPQAGLDSRCNRVLTHTRPDNRAGCLALRLALVPQGALDSRCNRVLAWLVVWPCDLHSRPKAPLTVDAKGFLWQVCKLKAIPCTMSAVAKVRMMHSQ